MVVGRTVAGTTRSVVGRLLRDTRRRTVGMTWWRRRRWWGWEAVRGMRGRMRMGRSSFVRTRMMAVMVAVKRVRIIPASTASSMTTAAARSRATTRQRRSRVRVARSKALARQIILGHNLDGIRRVGLGSGGRAHALRVGGLGVGSRWGTLVPGGRPGLGLLLARPRLVSGRLAKAPSEGVHVGGPRAAARVGAALQARQAEEHVEGELAEAAAGVAAVDAGPGGGRAEGRHEVPEVGLLISSGGHDVEGSKRKKV